MGSPVTAAKYPPPREVQPPPLSSEIAPPALSSLWRKSAHYFRAVPVCRTCAIEHKLVRLVPAPDEAQMCQVANCENRTAYLSIT